MRHRLAVSVIAGWCFFLIATAIGASILNGKGPAEQLPAVVLCVVGVVLVVKVPGNRIGWLLLLSGSVLAWMFLGNSVNPDQWIALFPEPVVMAFVWSGNIIWVMIPITVITIVFLFPTGRLPSRRWRALAWVGIVGTALMLIAMAFETMGYEKYPFDNPLGSEEIGELFLIPGSLLILIYATGAVVSLVVRYRSSTGDERAQIRWVLFASVMALILFVSGNVVSDIVPGGWGLIFALIFVAVPVAIAVAILRFRLYDIDKIVSRTLTYAIVVVVLGVGFAVAVAVPTLLLGTSDGEPPPDWLVAGATIGAFLLFNPLRRRVQVAVERRFNRLPYSPQIVNDQLQSGIRDTVDPDALTTAWRSAAVDSLTPTSAGVWMRQQS